MGKKLIPCVIVCIWHILQIRRIPLEMEEEEVEEKKRGKEGNRTSASNEVDRSALRDEASSLCINYVDCRPRSKFRQWAVNVTKKTTLENIHRAERSSGPAGARGGRQSRGGGIKGIVDTCLMSDRYHDENAVSNRSVDAIDSSLAPFIRLPISWRPPRNPPPPPPVSLSLSLVPAATKSRSDRRQKFLL